MLAPISNLFGSVLMRLALIFGALIAMTAAAIVIGWMVFQTIAGNMQSLEDKSLPDLQQSASVVAVADRVRALLADMLIAPDPDVLNGLNFKKGLVIEDIRTAAAAFGDNRTEQLQSMIDEVESALDDLSAARDANFTMMGRVSSVLDQTMQQATEARQIIATRNDGAYFNLVLGADSTISTIDQTLSTLIEQDFALYQTILEMRAEMNLLSGLALNMSQTRDAAMISILRDLADASSDTIARKVTLLEQNDATQEIAQLAAGTAGSFTDSIGGQGPRLTPSAVLSLRQQIDSALTSTLDDLYFDLVIKSDDAKTGNEESILALMDGEVDNIRTQAALDSATKSYFAAVLQVALSNDEVELTMRADALTLAATVLREALETASDDIKSTVDPMLAMTDSDTGIVSIRKALLDAELAAKDASERAASAVRDIAVTSAGIAASAKDTIYESASILTAEVNGARDRMQQIAIASIVMALVAPLLIWKMVSAPLNHVTRLTERLAQGDLSEIEGLDGKTGEWPMP